MFFNDSRDNKCIRLTGGNDYYAMSGIGFAQRETFEPRHRYGRGRVNAFVSALIELCSISITSCYRRRDFMQKKIFRRVKIIRRDKNPFSSSVFIRSVVAFTLCDN